MCLEEWRTGHLNPYKGPNARVCNSKYNDILDAIKAMQTNSMTAPIFERMRWDWWFRAVYVIAISISISKSSIDSIYQ